jgi:hypothetical protein
MNEHYKTLMEIADTITSRLEHSDVSVAVFGSGNYGNIGDTLYVCKPNAASDLDLFVIAEQASVLNSLRENLQISNTGLKLFEDRYLDMLVIRGSMHDRKISINFMRPENYEFLCGINKNNDVVLQHKRLITRKPHASPTYEYPVYCNTCEHKQQSRIVQLDDGHLIAYPVNNVVDNHLCLTVFQDQILTQKELLDHSKILLNSRIKLQDTLISEMTSMHADPLDYFKLTKPYWDKKFEKLMRDRFDNRR